MIDVQIVRTQPSMCRAASAPSGQRVVVAGDVEEAAIQRVGARNTAAATVTQMYFGAAHVDQDARATASATDASSWLATPNIGQIVLICPV